MSYIANTEPVSTHQSLEASARIKLRRLTKRENQVLLYIIAGYPNKIIAHNMGISLRTTENHRAKIMKKTGCRSLAGLVALMFLGSRGCLSSCAFCGECINPNDICSMRAYLKTVPKTPEI